MSAQAAPAVLWGRCDRAHVCLGASQDAAAELDPDVCARLGLGVFRRPLGGGTVLVDPWQWCFFVIVPGAVVGGPRRRFLVRCLDVAAATFVHYGIEARPAGDTDLWVEGRKILGSGAASVGQAWIWGASFLLRFDAATFAAIVRAPGGVSGAGFRQWLAEELDAGMTDWGRCGTLPDPEDLERRFRREIEAKFGWRLQDGGLSAGERRALPEAREDLAEVNGGRKPRRVGAGIKIRHRAYLLEAGSGTGRIRLVVRDGRIVRLGWWPEHAAANAAVERRGAWAVRARVLEGALGGVRDAPRVARAMTRLALRTLEEAADEPADD